MKEQRDSFRLNRLDIQQGLMVVLTIGVLFYVLGFFLLPSSKQNTIFYLTVIFPWLLLLPYSLKKGVLPSHPIFKLIVIGLIYYCISSFWSSDPGESFNKVAKYAAYIFIFISSVHLLINHKENNENHIIKIIFFSAIISGVLTVIQQWGSLVDGRLMHSMVTGVSSNPINTAVFFGVAALMAVHIFRATEKNSYAILALLTFFFFYTIIFFSKSRGPIIALFIALPIMFFFLKARTKLRNYIFLGLLFIFMLSLTNIAFEQTSQRFSEPNYRIEIWTAGFELLKDNLLFGTGLNYNDKIIISEHSFTHVHNSFLQFLVTGGLAGAGLFGAVIIFAISIGLRNDNPTIRIFTIWFLFGCLCLSTNGKLLIARPSSIWFSFWLPLTLILVLHVKLLDSSKNKHFSALSDYLRWQKGYSRIRWQLNVISGLWMSSFAWIVSKTEDKIKTEPCDVLVLYRRKNARQDTRLVELLSEKHRVKSAFQVKRPKMIKQRLLAKVPWLVPASLYIQASYAQFLVYKYQPKIIITSANGSALSPFLRAAMNDSAGSIVHIAHSVPTENHRGFSLIDVDYYFVYGKSSIDKLQQRQHLFGTAKCIETGSWVINELDTEMTLNENKMEKAVLLLGSGPKVELRDSTEKIYKLVIAWVLDHPEFKLYFKPHPRSDCGLWNRLIVDIDANKFEKIDNLSSNVAHCYAAIAPYTNAVLDVSLLGIPPLWISTKDDDDEFSYEDFFGMRTDNEQQLSEKLTDYIDRPDFYKEQTKLFANYHIHHPQQGVAEFMAETIEQIMIGKGELLDGEIVSESQMK